MQHFCQSFAGLFKNLSISCLVFLDGFLLFFIIFIAVNLDGAFSLYVFIIMNLLCSTVCLWWYSTTPSQTHRKRPCKAFSIGPVIAFRPQTPKIWRVASAESDLTSKFVFVFFYLIIFNQFSDLIYKLMKQKTPPLEKVQVIIGTVLRILTSTTTRQQTLTCCVYPELKWPSSVNKLVHKMMLVVLTSLEKHSIVSNR